MHGSISFENISFSKQCDIKTTNVKSITDASIWVMFTSKNSDMFEIAEHSLLLSFRAVGFISGQLISLTNPIHRIPCQFVNTPAKRLFCDRALLSQLN